MSKTNHCLKLLFCSFLLPCATNMAQADSLGSSDNNSAFDRMDSANIIRPFDLKRMFNRSLEFSGPDYKDSRSLDNTAAANQNNAGDGSRNDSFDGSEFNASTFVDSDFRKQTYRDLFNSAAQAQNRAAFFGSRSGSSKCGSTGASSTATLNNTRNNYFSCDPDHRKKVEKDRENFNKLTRPVYFIPGEWAPSNIDITSNGGFTDPTNNGSPVPYRLNGHLNLQRNFPWEDEN